MLSKTKTIGVALVAALALGAIAASGAMASQDAFDVHGANSAIVTAEAETDQAFTFGPSQVPTTCKRLSIEEATVFDGATSLTTQPTFSECTTPLGAGTVDTNGCHFAFTGQTDEDGHADVDIQCGANPIRITMPLGCTVSIGSQTLTGVSYDNVDTAGTSEDEITFTFTVEDDLSYTATAICGLAGIPTAGEDGDYTGSIIVKGFEDINGKEGSRIGISAATEE